MRGISQITIRCTFVSINEMFVERLIFVAARLDDVAARQPPLTYIPCITMPPAPPTTTSSFIA